MSSLNQIGHPFIELHTVDSTNNYAMGLVHAGMAQHGTVVFSHEQTKGRGQRNRKWVSEPRNNIALSVIIEPRGLSSSQLFLLSKTIATGTMNFFNNYAKSGTTIKWPNDIYWRDRKAGGILIENVLQGNDWKYAVAGIGLNINQTQFTGLGNKAVSLKQITGVDYHPLQLAKELCQFLENQFQKFMKQPGSIAKEYQKNLYKLGETVKFKKGSRVFEARVKEVTDRGVLVVEHKVEERFDIGEVDWVLS